VFPTTVWTTIREAGESGREALEAFATAYRGPVLRYLERRGFEPNEAEDVCQEVFLRLLRSELLSRADARYGRFRSLLVAVVHNTIGDRLRKRRDATDAELEPVYSDPDFDREWVLELVERALKRLREEGSPYYEVLRGHLDGEKQDRNKLWIARGKLRSLMRHEVASTCSSPRAVEDELAYLSTYLDSPEKR